MKRPSRILHRLVLGLVWATTAMVAQAQVTVVEYFHSGFGHYFVTPVANEIALLDARTPPFELWSRTGFTFEAYASATAPSDAVAICRFFNDSFAPKSSHFYAPRGFGCEATLERFPDWKLEDDHLFSARLPGADGACPSGTPPVYRLYNDGQSGAPNHRFVTSLAERQAMLDKGYLAEGAGQGIGMCVPAARAPAVGMWRGTSNLNQSVRILILDDGAYYILYSRQGANDDAGVVFGNGSHANGRFASEMPVDVPFQRGGVLLLGKGSLAAEATARASLQMTYGTASIAATYEPAYDQPLRLADIAGTYHGTDGHRADPHPARVTLDAAGYLAIDGDEFDFAGIVTPRAGTAIFDVLLTGAVLNNAPSVIFFDAVRQKLYMVVPFPSRDDVLFFFVSKL